MARKVFRNLGARISKAKKQRDKKSEEAAKVVVVPEIRTVPVSSKVTEVNLGTSYKHSGGQSQPISQTPQKPVSGKTSRRRKGAPAAQPSAQMNAPISGQAQGTPVPVPVPMNAPGAGRYQQARGQQRSVIREKYEAIPLKVSEKELPFLGKEDEEVSEKIQSIKEQYPLISMKFKGKKVTVAWANIRWSPQRHSLIYRVIEPKLDEKEVETLEEIKSLLRDKLDVDFTKIKLESAYSYLMRKFSDISSELSIKMDTKSRIKFQYYLYRDFIGLGPIEPLMHDPNIEDVSCDGAGIPIFVYHRKPLYGQLETDIIFQNKDILNSFVLKLAQKAGRTLTIAEPLLDGALPDGSRVQATLGTDIARKGSNFTIRKFPENPMTPTDLIGYGTASPEILSYLWLCIENRLSVLVCGPTATGKTTFLNSLSLFIKPELKIVSIEDTPELQLPHENWVPVVARTGFGIKGYGDVTMFDLLKASLRQRPDYVIVGEVRGEEAYVMFQGMATGHPGLGTLHADSFPAVIDRLTTKPIDLPMAMLENLDLVVFLMMTKRKGSYIRRVSEIVEIVGYDYNMKDVVTNTSFRWDPMKDEFILQKSVLLDKIRERMGFSVEDLKREMSRRIRVLKWMRENKVSDYRRFAKVVATYYNNPKFLEQVIKGETEL